MGRIKTTPVKRATIALFKEHGDIFTSDFKENKAKVSEHLQIRSKKIRNVIAGYVTRLKNRGNTE